MIADVVRTNPSEAEVRSRRVSAGTFERTQTDSGWELRPNEGTARHIAAFHAGCLTLPAIVVLGACGWFVWTRVDYSLVGNLENDWSAMILGIGCGVAILGSAPLLVAWARHVFRKSLRDNWLTMRVLPGGPIRLGEETLVETGRAREIVVRRVEESDGEGGTAVSHCVDVVQDRECAAPVAIPIPLHGMWNPSVRDRRNAEAFAEVLAGALGVAVRKPAIAPKTH